MSSLSFRPRKPLGESLQPENSSPIPRSKSPWKSVLRFRKSTKSHDREPKNPSPQVDPASLSTFPEYKADTTTPSEADNIWLRAEKTLSEDNEKKKIFQAYLEILESEFGTKLKPSGTADRQKQLCQLLDSKTQELEDKWKVRFGDHDKQIGNLLHGAFKNVLMAKDLVNSAASANPPAAIACAGVTVVLTVSITPYQCTQCVFIFAYISAASHSSRRAKYNSSQGLGIYLRVNLPPSHHGRSLSITGKASVSRPRPFHLISTKV
jgi:hypothetical protein